MSLILEGTLADIRLGDLLRLIAREQRTGELRVTLDGTPYRFVLCEGSLLAAKIGEEEEPADVQATLLALIRHRRGEFRLAPGEVEATTSGIHAEHLAGMGDMDLLQLAERFDRAGGEASHPRRDAFPTPRQMEALASPQRSVYGLIDGERSLEEIILRSRLDPVEVLDALDALVQEGMVRLETGPAEAAPPAGATAASRVLRVGADAMAAALPLALLLGWLALAGPVAVSDGAPFEIHRDPLAAARAAYDVEQLRAAVEAHRFAEGRWPARLGELASRGYVPDDALTDAKGRPYYYAAREDGFVLLAPER